MFKATLSSFCKRVKRNNQNSLVDRNRGRNDGLICIAVPRLPYSCRFSSQQSYGFFLLFPRCCFTLFEFWPIHSSNNCIAHTVSPEISSKGSHVKSNDLCCFSHGFSPAITINNLQKSFTSLLCEQKF